MSCISTIGVALLLITWPVPKIAANGCTSWFFAKKLEFGPANCAY